FVHRSFSAASSSSSAMTSFAPVRKMALISSTNEAKANGGRGGSDARDLRLGRERARARAAGLGGDRRRRLFVHERRHRRVWTRRAYLSVRVERQASRRSREYGGSTAGCEDARPRPQ